MLPISTSKPNIEIKKDSSDALLLTNSTTPLHPIALSLHFRVCPYRILRFLSLFRLYKSLIVNELRYDSRFEDRDDHRTACASIKNDTDSRHPTSAGARSSDTA